MIRRQKTVVAMEVAQLRAVLDWMWVTKATTALVESNIVCLQVNAMVNPKVKRSRTLNSDQNSFFRAGFPTKRR